MHGVRALLALSGVLAVGWQRDWSWQVMPVLLGVVASALTETDDNWLGRLRTQLLAMAIFAVIAWVVWATQPWPWLLGGALAVSAFVLSLSGALGERYRVIGFASLVFFIYVALTLPPGAHLRVNLRALQGLSANLTEQAAVLSRVLQPAPAPTERTLVNDQPRSIGEAWQRVKAQLHVRSALFRQGQSVRR